MSENAWRVQWLRCSATAMAMATRRETTPMSAIEPYTCVSRSGHTILIRTARPADALAIYTITAEAIAEGPYHISEPQEFASTLEHEELWIRQHAEHPAQALLLAEVGGAVVGLVHFEPGARRRQAH